MLLSWAYDCTCVSLRSITYTKASIKAQHRFGSARNYCIYEHLEASTLHIGALPSERCRWDLIVVSRTLRTLRADRRVTTPADGRRRWRCRRRLCDYDQHNKTAAAAAAQSGLFFCLHACVILDPVDPGERVVGRVAISIWV